MLKSSKFVVRIITNKIVSEFRPEVIAYVNIKSEI